MPSQDVVATRRWPVAVEFAGRSGPGFDPADRPVPANDSRAANGAADLIMMSILMLARGAAAGSENVRQGTSALSGPAPIVDAQLTGRTLGLVGFGSVGREIARRAQTAFGMRVLVYDRLPLEQRRARASGLMCCATLEELLAEADFVALHGGGGGALIDAPTLDQMKASAFLIDTTGGQLVERQALVHALWFETIAGVALVIDPSRPQVVSDLLACPNALLLSHQTPAAPIPSLTMRRHPAGGSAAVSRA